jgi:cysteine sulfinate desulfinase/cysteine desulfurase-like protein
MEPAAILLAMGCPVELAKSSVRFSLSAHTTIPEIEEAARRIIEVVGRLRSQPAGTET